MIKGINQSGHLVGGNVSRSLLRTVHTCRLIIVYKFILLCIFRQALKTSETGL